jgi:hypothetical protein
VNYLATQTRLPIEIEGEAEDSVSCAAGLSH